MNNKHNTNKFDQVEEEIESFFKIDIPFIKLWVFDEFQEGLRDGYAYPAFPFIELATRDVEVTNQASMYIDYFDLKGEQIIKPDKVSQLITFRNGLMNQMKRQFQACLGYNNGANISVRIFYQEIFSLFKTKYANTDITEKLENLCNKIFNLIYIINHGVLYEDYICKYKYLVKDLSDAPKKLKSTIHNELKQILELRDPIIKEALELEKKINIIENLIYFALKYEGIYERGTYEQIQLQTERLKTPQGKVELVEKERKKKGERSDADALKRVNRRYGTIYKSVNSYHARKSQLKKESKTLNS